MRNTLDKIVGIISKSLGNEFSKEFRAKFRREIYVTDIEKDDKQITFHYRLNPYINLRVFSHYEAYLISEYKELKLECFYDKYNISVKLPMEEFENADSNVQVKLYSNGQLMKVKRTRNNNLLRRFINHNKLYKITTPKVINIKPEMEQFYFTDKKVLLDSVDTTHDKIKLNFTDYPVTDETKLYVFYQYKFVEVFGISTSNNSVIIDDFGEFSNGHCNFYIGNDETLYPLYTEENIEKEFNTNLYKFKIYSLNNKFVFDVEDHILSVNEMTIDYSSDNNVKFTFDFIKSNDDDFVRSKSTIAAIDTLAEEILYGVESNEDYYFNLNDLVNHFSRKKLILMSNNRQYQLDVSEATINNNIEPIFNFKGEDLTVAFYKRKDGYLGFRVRRPSLYRLVTDIDSFTFTGKIKNRGRFNDLTQCLIFRDRVSENDYYIEIDNEFNITPNLNRLLDIMSADKTIIDIYLGFLNDEKEIIREAKIKYKNSNYKKDNYYAHKVLNKPNDDEVHFLVTTTPFDNLKIETFVIPKEIKGYDHKKNYNTWLIGERSDTAQENGISLFKYLINHDEIDAYYVISEESKDYDRIKHLNNVLIFGSEEHFKVATQAGVLLCTHDFENILPFKPARGFFNYEDTIKVFLQHGVLGRKSAEYHKKYYDLPFDLFIVSSEDEKEKIVMDIMGYDSDAVAVTGLARFDDLPFNNETKNILLMPTWREWINNDNQFLNSQYYFRYLNLINNKRLEYLLEKYDLKLKFYPHYRAQTFFNKDHLDTNDRIEFIELGERTVQDLLIEHSLLITDYSSVSFDFTMMDKPVIYYHFDVKRFFNKGLLRSVEETFLGDIAYSEEELIDYIQEAIQDNFENKVEDVSGILKYRDHDNRKRIVESVKKLTQNM